MKNLVDRQVSRIFLCFVFFLGTSFSVFSQEINWSGVWSNNVTQKIIDSDTFVIITKNSDSDYYYVSCYSTYIPILNFFGEGKINSNKELEVTTTKGDIFIFFEAWDARYSEVFSILSLSVGDSIENVYRIKDRLNPGDIFKKGNVSK
ncbi:MAG: hypothetical protein JXN62_11985 [Bacteroidales bacterium]|nr:hypothetical protein [Bacteroidales bacterium]